MKISLATQEIKCQTLWDAEAVIKKAETKLDTAKNYKEKQYYAQDILLELEALLVCGNFNPINVHCTNCHSIISQYMKEYN